MCPAKVRYLQAYYDLEEVEYDLFGHGDHETDATEDGNESENDATRSSDCAPK